MAKDLPRKGPSGTYSHAWRSREDQSLRSVTPKTCSRKSDSGTDSPERRACRRRSRPRPRCRAAARRRTRGAVLVRRLALALGPHDGRARDDDGAGTAVVADGQVLPVGSERVTVRAEDPPDVGGVVLAGVEVDVVGDLERQPQPHLGERVHEASRDVPVLRERSATRAARARTASPDGTARRHQRVEQRLPQKGGVGRAEGLGGRTRVQHGVAVAHDDAAAGPVRRWWCTRRREGCPGRRDRPRAGRAGSRRSLVPRLRDRRRSRASSGYGHPPGPVRAALCVRTVQGSCGIPLSCGGTPEAAVTGAHVDPRATGYAAG